MALFRRVELRDDVPGRLHLHSMPGRYEALQAFVDEALRVGLDRVVCLAPIEEIRAKSPDYAAALEDGSFPVPIRRFPILDFEVADDPRAFSRLAGEIAYALESGQCLLIHCAGGVGRTGTLASCVLIALGEDTERARRAVRRAGSGAETAAQREGVEAFARHPGRGQRSCSRCGRRPALPVRYGYPDDVELERARLGEVVLGGCVLTGDDPSALCSRCGAGAPEALE